MTTLTSSATFPIGNGSTIIETVQITILPVAGAGQGKGRLVHPTLGTYDYPHQPTDWSGFNGDLFVAPVWANAKTLGGGVNTLWPGYIKDVVVTEGWDGEGGLSMPVAMLEVLASFWQNPPDPAVATIQWYPSYANNLGFKAALTDIDINGSGFNMNYVTDQGWVFGPVKLTMRIIDRV